MSSQELHLKISHFEHLCNLRSYTKVELNLVVMILTLSITASPMGGKLIV